MKMFMFIYFHSFIYFSSSIFCESTLDFIVGSQQSCPSNDTADNEVASCSYSGGDCEKYTSNTVSSDDEISDTSSSSDDDNEDSEMECGVGSEIENSEWSIAYNKDLYTTGIAVEKLHKDSPFTVLQWLAMNFHLFSTHPAMSKTAFSNQMMLYRFYEPSGS